MTVKAKDRVSHAPNLMPIRSLCWSRSFALDSALVKCGVWTGPKCSSFLTFTICTGKAQIQNSTKNRLKIRSGIDPNIALLCMHSLWKVKKLILLRTSYCLYWENKTNTQKCEDFWDYVIHLIATKMIITIVIHLKCFAVLIGSNPPLILHNQPALTKFGRWRNIKPIRWYIWLDTRLHGQ